MLFIKATTVILKLFKLEHYFCKSLFAPIPILPTPKKEAAMLREHFI